MTQEEKQLLLKDLCGRLPYGVICVGVTYDLDDDGERYIPVKVRNTLTEIHNYRLETASVKLDLISSCKLETIKPYLRPMSSMTEEEKEEFHKLKQFSVTVVMPNGVSLLKPTYIVDLEEDGDGLNHLYDWLNAHHFDYRGLIEKGLALEAPKDMYK